jgi:hypothetical protein
MAARKGDDELAAQYLNTHLKGKAAADLAHQLFVVFDRRLPTRFRVPSDKPEGLLSDTLRPDRELLGTVDSESGNIEIILERVDRGKSGSRWSSQYERVLARELLYHRFGASQCPTPR